ncbi:MAG: carbohydrate deacetylase [Myxococcaceae bacterium]
MRRLIINADDLGYDPAVDAGLLRAMRRGVVSSATLLVNTPFSRAAAEAAHGLAVGLHLNLARGRPVSPNFPGELLEAGAFAETRAEALTSRAVEDEARAQLRRAEQLLGRRPTHLDVHKHLHRHAAVLAGAAAAAAAWGLPVRALDSGMRAALRAHGVASPEHFVGEAGGEAFWTLPRFLAALEALSVGTTEFMCHPGEPPTHVQSGYAAQRQVELDTLTSPQARAGLERAGVVLVDFRALGPASPQPGAASRSR